MPIEVEDYVFTYKKHTHNNHILILNSTFTRNRGNLGGGGAQVRLGEQESGLENYILFKRVTFINNTASFGGGTSINAMFISNVTEAEGIVQFTNCTWFNNYGRYSPAVDLSPCRFQQSNQGYLPIPLFKDIIVTGNHVLKPKARGPNHVVQGVFAITRFFVQFQSSLLLKRNWHSALYLTSGRAIFDKNSNVIFHSNWAIQGGAVAIHGFSGIILNDNSHFLFINNRAARVGGGIFYALSDQREYFEGRSCFLMYGGKENNISKRNITITFCDNKAPLGGLSIYSESLFSCYFAYYEKYTYNLTKLFDRIGHFYFDAPNLASGAWPLATAARNVRLEGRPSVTAIPGERLQLPLAMYDEFYHIKPSEFALRIKDNKMVHLENYFTVNNSTRIYGAPNQTMTLVLSTPQPLFAIEYFIRVRLLPCSPGFFHDEVTESCKCSADSQSHTYPAITKCNELGTFIKSNYWAGYYPSGDKHPDHLYTAFYPSMFENYANLRMLPNNSNHLSDFMCGNTREGALCGTCKIGHSAFYHSREMVCGQNTVSCNFGMFIFLLSEIPPATLFFAFVMMSGVNFSSGWLNGFIFYSQVVDAFSQDLVISEIQHGGIPFKVFKSGHQLIYGTFNFDYFSTFPFCMWKGATAMDVIAFKYVTTTFAFALIIFIVIAMNYSTKRCSHNISFLKHYTGKHSSATHGISAVLIISYGQCTRVGFFLLTKAYLRGKPGVHPIPVTYYGGLPYFGNEHVPYVIPAIIFSIVLVCLPPFCLILYPSSFHLLELCGLSEHRYVNTVSRLLCLSRFMPLLDAFQSCYKDKMRFFAGFYFLYRVMAFLMYMYSETIPPVLIAVLILGIHSVLQPYKSWQHNVIVALVFLNITIINCFTIMIKFSLITENTENKQKFEMVQLTFIYLPFLFLLLALLIKLGKKIGLKHIITVRTREESYQCSNLTKTIPQADVTHSSVELNKPLLLELESNTVQHIC